MDCEALCTPIDRYCSRAGTSYKCIDVLVYGRAQGPSASVSMTHKADVNLPGVHIDTKKAVKKRSLHRVRVHVHLSVRLGLPAQGSYAHVPARRVVLLHVLLGGPLLLR